MAKQTKDKGVRSAAGRMAVGHPVDVATGSQSDDFSDHVLPGRMPLDFARRYSSSMPGNKTGMFGPGWSSPFEMYLSQDIDGYNMIAEDGESIIAFDDSDGLLSAGGVIRNLGMFCELQLSGSDYLVTKWSPDDQDVVQYVFPQGRAGEPWLLSSKRNLAGQGIDVVRDRDQRILRLQQKREGRGYLLTYDCNGRVSEVTLTAHEYSRQILRYTYDSAGRLYEQMDALGQRSTYEYDERGRLIREVNIAGMVYHFRYDSKGRCIENTGLDGYGRVTLHIDELGKSTKVADALDNVTTYLWNGSGQVERKISPLGYVTQTFYDEEGRIVTKLEPSGAKTEYEFDERGDLVQVTSPTGAVTRYEHNDQHQVVCVTDPVGHKWRRAYNKSGQLESTTNPLGQSLNYRHNRQGDLIEVKDDACRTWRLTYSSAGDLLSSTDAMGASTHYEYNPTGKLTAIISARGNRTEVRLDVLDRVVEVRLPDGARRRMSRNAYDQLTEFVDEVGAVSRWRYAACGLITEEVRPHEGRIQYEWSPQPGQLLAVHNELGERYSFEYDEEGRLVQERDFAGREKRYDYGKGNQITTVHNAAGERIELRRNAEGALIEVVPSIGQPAKYEYDARGFLTQANNGTCSVERDYDEVGRLIRERQGTHEVVSQYDVAGNRVVRRSSLGQQRAFEWDNNGQLAKILDPKDGSLCFEYDKTGSEIRRFIENGVEIEHVYDVRARRTKQRVLKPDESWLDQSGQATKPLILRQYTYDLASNLTDIVDAQQGRTRYYYDIAGRIVETLLPAGYTEAFVYDSADNLIKHVRNQIAHRLSYEAGSQLVQYRDVFYQRNQLGQLICKTQNGQETKFSWNAYGELTAATQPDGTQWQYLYDPLGRRIRKVGPTESVEFIWDGDVVLHEIHHESDKPSVVINWEFEPQSFAPIFKEKADIRYLCVNDTAGAPKELIGPNGNIEWRAAFDTFGREFSTLIENTECPVRFQGQWYDAEIGLNYNRFRYYDPEIGQFISPDPIGLAGGLNSFSSGLNPINWVDPYGLTKKKCPQIVYRELSPEDRAALDAGKPLLPKGSGGSIADHVDGKPTGLFLLQTAKAQ